MNSNADFNSTEAYNLLRFLDAQRGIYAQVMTEPRAGRKDTHSMWFILPQIKGRGNSPTAVARVVRIEIFRGQMERSSD
jgi:uncharacterized protein (DUF1810 family)